MKLFNALSINMLAVPNLATLALYEVSGEVARATLLRSGGVESYIGHADTAAVVAADLDLPVAPNRQSVKVSAGERFLVAQYIGPRLPEGATSLPEGATIRYFAVHVGSCGPCEDYRPCGCGAIPWYAPHQFTDDCG
jgi:hypothetical protein